MPDPLLRRSGENSRSWWNCDNLPVFTTNKFGFFTNLTFLSSYSTAQREKRILLFDNFTRIAVDKNHFGTYNRHDVTPAECFATPSGK